MSKSRNYYCNGEWYTLSTSLKDAPCVDCAFCGDEELCFAAPPDCIQSSSTIWIMVVE